jgi:hypothetical protein
VTDEREEVLLRELRRALQNNHKRNLQLDALHFVWCDGGCLGGVHRYDGRPHAVTEEIVQEAERNTARLRRWLTNYAFKGHHKLQPHTPHPVPVPTIGGCAPMGL